MMKGQARGRPGAAASLPNPGAAATAASPAASVGAASAKTAYQQYVKGKRREGLEVLKRAHEESPSAATCLLGAKLHVLEAAEAAFKDDAGDEARENAVLLHLHLAMVLAAEGAMDHRSLTCLHLLTFLLHCTEGRPGWDERRSIHECVGEALFPGELYASEDCEPRRATAHPWLGFASEVPGLDKWQFEDIGSRASQQQVVKKVCKEFCRLERSSRLYDSVAKVTGGGVSVMGSEADSKHLATPADVRMAEICMLPAKLNGDLARHQRQRWGAALPIVTQSKHQVALKLATEKRAEHALPEQVLKRRRQELPALKARAAKIRDFLLSRAAAAEGGEGPSAVKPQPPSQPGDEAARPARQLGPLLRQTELAGQELRALLAQGGEPDAAAQRQALLGGLRRAQQGQALCCELPEPLADLMASLLPSDEQQEQQGAAPCTPVVVQARRLARQLSQLAWEPGQPLAVEQLHKVLRSSKTLRAIQESPPAPLGQAAHPSVAIQLPDVASLEVLPECPGDLELLGQGTAAADGGTDSGPPPRVLVMLESLRARRRKGAGSAQPTGLEQAGAIAGLTPDAGTGDEDGLPGPAALNSIARGAGSGLDVFESLSLGEADGPQLPAQDRPLRLLEEGLQNHVVGGWLLEPLLGFGALEYFELTLSSLDGTGLSQQLCRRLLCAQLLGQEVLELLEERAEAAAAAGAAGQPPEAPPEALVGRLARLAACVDRCAPYDPPALARALAETPEQGEGLALLLADLDCGNSPAAAGFTLAWGVLYDSVAEHSWRMLALKQDPTPVARDYVQQARRRLCRRILLGLQALQEARCLTPSLLATLRSFLATAAAVAGSDSYGEGCSPRSSGAAAAAAAAAAAGGPGAGPPDGAVFAGLGRLPLRHLLELYAFLGILLGTDFASPAALLPELQEAMVCRRTPAEPTPDGGVRLTAHGLQALGTEVAAIEAFREDREAPEAARRTFAEHVLAAGDKNDNAEAAADLLASYGCGVPQAEAELARRVTVAGVEAHLQGLLLDRAMRVLAGAQRLACIHRLLAGLVGGAQRALQETQQLSEQLEGVLGPLSKGAGLLVPPEVALRGHLAARFTALRDSLTSRLEGCNSIAQAAHDAVTGLKREFNQYEARLLQGEEERAKAQADLLPPLEPEREQLDKRRKEADLRLKAVAQQLQMRDLDELMSPGFRGRYFEPVRTAKQLLGVLARKLDPTDDDDAAQLVSHSVQATLVAALQAVRELLLRQASSLDESSRFLQALADRAAVQAELGISELVYAHSLRPSLEPAFRALTRHLLAPKWEAELAAQQAAEEEARREAALQALLQEEEEEDGGSAAAQAKQEQKRAKKKAKKAAKKKEAPAAVDQAALQQQAAPQGAEHGQDSRQQEREAGLQRLLQQMEEDQEEQARQQQQQQQEEHERERVEEVERQQQLQQQRKDQQLPPEGEALVPVQPAAEGACQEREGQQVARPEPEEHAAAGPSQSRSKRGSKAAAKESAGPAVHTTSAAPAAGLEQPPAKPLGRGFCEEEHRQQGSQQAEEQTASPAPPQHEQEGEEEGGWQQAAVSHRRGSRASKAAIAPPVVPPQPRPAAIVSWDGHWRCSCGVTVPPRINCRECGGLNPCREYVFGGGCSRGGPPYCKFPHPPFDLPRGPRPPAGRTLIAPPAGVPLHGFVPPPSVARPAREAAAAGRPHQLTGPASPGAKASSTHASPGAPIVAPRPASAGPWQARRPAAAAAADEERPPSAAPAAGRLGGSGGSKASTEDWPAVLQGPAAGGAGAAAPAGGVDAELASLLGMMGVDSEELGPEAGALAGPDTSSSWGQPPGPAAGGSWAQRAGGGVSSEPGADSPTAAAEAAPWPAPGQSQEDAELEAAIKASLAEATAAAEGAWRPSSRSPPAPEARAVSPAPAENGLGLAGLRNEAGEYNCFLNVIVQCLWRCADFRRQVAGWDPAFCGSDPVVSCLHDLFQQFQRQEEQLQGSSSGDGEAEPSPRGLSPVDPTPLREALAALPGQQFRVGEMNDAAEVLLAIYERVMEVAAGRGRPAGIEPTFGLSVREEVHCPSCSKATHQTSYTQYFYNTQATVLHMLRDAYDGSLSTGRLLREAEAQHQKTCDKDVGGCGRPCPVNYLLQHAPRVFTLQLAWESHSEQPADIAATLAAIDEEIDLGEVYQGTERGSHRYRLRSMVCYYGQHYQALVLVPEAGGWLVFDDTRVARVGGWDAVRRKCEAGRIQPSVLFYEVIS